MNEFRRNIIGGVFCGIAMAMVISPIKLNPLVEVVIYAAFITIGLYFAYENEKERFIKRAELLQKNYRLKIEYDQESKMFSYSCFGDEITKEKLLEVVQLSFEKKPRKALLYLDYLEDKSKHK